MTAANSITTTAFELIKSAMKEIGALAPGETPSNEDQADVKVKLQRLIDRWNANGQMTFNVNFQTFTIVPSIQPITIGPGAMFDVNQRPVEIASIGLMLTNATPNVKVYLNNRDQKWWSLNRVPQLTSTLATDYYYSPDWPTGKLYLWPIPTSTNDLLLEMRYVLTEITSMAQSFSMPPGYWDATVYALAESICPMFERPVTADLLRLKMEAIRNVEGNNIASPRGITGDAGMPGVGSRGGFDYYSALPTSFSGGR